MDRHPVEAEDLVDDADDRENLEDLDHQMDFRRLDNVDLELLLNLLALETGAAVQDLPLGRMRRLTAPILSTR